MSFETNTPWLGPKADPKTRPVQSKNASAKQIAQTIIQEMKDPGYLVSFYDGDDIRLDDAVLILAKAVNRRR